MTSGVARAPLLLGAGGMLGAAVAARLETLYPDTVSATRDEADVTDRFRLEAEVERLQPTVVVNCAAYTDVDGCEIDPARARRVNAEGAENVARAAAAVGARVIHISTDFVFDGRARRPYVESDPTGPLSEYGRSKLEGERRVAGANEDHLILRTAWLYGRGRTNFVDAIRALAARTGPLEVVEDQTGSPTYVVDLAEAIVKLFDVGHRGLLHVANRGTCSRFELARAILEILGLDAARVRPIRSDQSGRPARRPARSGLDSGLYQSLTGHSPRPWRDALQAYLGTADAGRGAS